MLKNNQVKILLILCVAGMLIIGGVGVFSIISLEQINNGISAEEIVKTSKMIDAIDNIERELRFIIGIAIIVFLITVILISKVLNQVVIYPMHKLIKSAKETPKREDIDINNNVFLHMTDGVMAFNIDGELILINPAAKNLLNISMEDINFSSIFDKFGLDINMEKIIYLENWTSTEQRLQVEDKYLNIYFASFRSENDRPAGVVAVVQDITEHVKLDNMRKEFIADVSHELKTPITSIMGYADTLLEGEYDKETQSKFLNVIATEARRMARLVTDLLTLSRYDSNKNTSHKEQFDLGELVKKCQDKLAIEIKKKNHKVDCFVTADVPAVYADKYDIERVVLNILSNSIKYTNDGGEIKIYVGFVYNDAYIKIFDNGIGIPEEDLNRIFERFYRVDKARTREMGGTGLGLSIAKDLLDRNNGSIDIKSVMGQGTEVVIKIPTKTE
jgi:two-component system sensor histidine kinase VicK